ncbi:hypothetical protein MMC17_000268 [Xylographa soralifera]|nr:hypothetical protein [Xylographa soralifera]
MQGDVADNVVEQPNRVIGADPPRVARKEDSEHFLGTSIDRQYSNSWDALRGIGPGVEDSTAPAPAHKEGKKKHKWEKPSWSDLFRVGGPPLRSYERDINRNQAQHDAAKAAAHAAHVAHAGR